MLLPVDRPNADRLERRTLVPKINKFDIFISKQLAENEYRIYLILLSPVTI